MSFAIRLAQPSGNGDPARRALEQFRWLSSEFWISEHDSDPTVYECGNYTSNVARMWYEALGCSLRDLKDRPCREAVEVLSAALTDMEGRPEHYRAMTPENGWGSFEGAHDYLLNLLVGCLRFPDAYIRIWA